MKLSEAILLGDSLKKCNPLRWLSRDGSCGCAFGGALLAAGITADDYWKCSFENLGLATWDLPIIKHLWPWLTAEHLGKISILYNGVAVGQKTIESIAAYVRSIEPAELPQVEPEELPEEPYWSDSDTTREMMNSIKGR